MPTGTVQSRPRLHPIECQTGRGASPCLIPNLRSRWTARQHSETEQMSTAMHPVRRDGWTATLRHTLIPSGGRLPGDLWEEYRCECATRVRLHLPEVSLAEFRDMRDWTDCNSRSTKMTTIGSPNRSTRRPMAAAGGVDGMDGRDGKMQAVLATLERGIAAILDGEEFARYLATLARFHMYSPKNVALIHVQNRDATRVAGYRAWQTLGRQVRKGERGIRIVVPYRARVASVEDDGQEQEIVTGWGIGHVWDVAQTDGKPLALPPIHGALTGDADGRGRGAGGTDAVAARAGRDARA